VSMAGTRACVIAIDGPAGAGKSTAAGLLARRLGYRLIDTGAMYRALAWSVARAGLPAEDGPALRRHLERLSLEVTADRVLVDGVDVTGEIRTPAISGLTSRLTTLACVRDKVTPLQRTLAAAGGVVLEGRDIGTVVCPDADVKFFLDASLDERARRRHRELAGRGVEMPLDRVREELAARDAQDRARAVAPLVKAEDAITLESTDRTPEQVVDLMLRAIERQCSTRA
jgi:cytidylate kinase